MYCSFPTLTFSHSFHTVRSQWFIGQHQGDKKTEKHRTQILSKLGKKGLKLDEYERAQIRISFYHARTESNPYSVHIKRSCLS